MKERPILFSAPMVRAILDGSKTQTRRVLKQQPPDWVKVWNGSDGTEHFLFERDIDDEGGRHWPDYNVGLRCPHGQIGDQLWVRESFANTDMKDGTPVIAYRAGGCIAIGRKDPADKDYLIRDFAFNENPHVDAWKPSIHMPRWASRITLEITGVRVERLQKISEADAIAEGIESLVYGGETTYRNYALTDDWAAVSPMLQSPIDSYRTLWESINGPGSWAASPWVWVIEFKRVKP